MSKEYERVIYGTKSSYNNMEEMQTPYTPRFKFDENFEVKMGYLISRHGARYPTEGSYQKILQLLEYLKTTNSQHLVSVDPSKYKIYNSNGELAQIGFKNQFQFGVRMGKILSPTIKEECEKKFTNSSSSCKNDQLAKFSTFKSTCVKRSIDSMKSFQSGFFYDFPNQDISHNQKCSNGKTLRFYDYCQKYKRKSIIKKATEEIYESELFRKFQKEFSIRFYGNKNLNVPAKYIRILYGICSFNVLIWNKNRKQDLVCRHFNTKDLAIMEYISDVKTEFKLGKMFESNKMMSAPLLKHIFESLDLNLNSKNSKFHYFAEFAHGETVLPILNLLDLIPSFSKQVIRGPNASPKLINPRNMKELLESARERRYGLIIPMNSNLQLFKLQNKKTKQMGISAYVNEKLVSIPCCERNMKAHHQAEYLSKVCPVDVFNFCFKRIEFNSDNIFNQFCSL